MNFQNLKSSQNILSAELELVSFQSISSKKNNFKNKLSIRYLLNWFSISFKLKSGKEPGPLKLQFLCNGCIYCIWCLCDQRVKVFLCSGIDQKSHWRHACFGRAKKALMHLFMDGKKILIQSIKYFKVFEVCQWFHLLWMAYLTVAFLKIFSMWSSCGFL